MRKRSWVIVYAGGTADTAVLRDLLDASGIAAQLADEVMGTMAPFVIAAGTSPAVKVMVLEDQIDDARDVVMDFATARREADVALPAWMCPRCREENESSYDICWNCQTERVGA